MARVKRSGAEPSLPDFLEAGRSHGGATVRFHEAISGRLGLGQADHKYFDLIFERGPMTAGELARLTGRSTGAITSVIDRLEANGIVRRTADPADRRRVIVEPAMTGERAREDAKLWTYALERWTELVSSYTKEELRLIIDFLRRDRDILNDATEALRELPAAPAGSAIASKSRPRGKRGRSGGRRS